MDWLPKTLIIFAEKCPNFTSTYCVEMPDTVKTSRIFVGSSNLYLYPQGGGEVAAAGGGVTNPGHGAPAQQPARQGGPWPGPQEQVIQCHVSRVTCHDVDTEHCSEIISFNDIGCNI